MKTMKNGIKKNIRVCIVAPSLDILGGQSRQAVRLLEGLHDEPTLEVDFIPHNPRLPRLLRKLEAIRYLRTIVRTPFYLAILLFRLHRFCGPRRQVQAPDAQVFGLRAAGPLHELHAA